VSVEWATHPLAACGVATRCCSPTGAAGETLTREFMLIRYIYLVRDGRDAATSFYHHLNNQAGAAGGFDGSFAQFEPQWSAGELPYGRWVDHVHAWDAASADARVLFVRFEDLCADPLTQIQRIVQHCELQVSTRNLAIWPNPLPPRTQDYVYSDAKVANRNAKVSHGVTENGP
jgi:hypothetical protein